MFFFSGTLVRLSNGQDLAIEEITPGTRVLAYNLDETKFQECCCEALLKFEVSEKTIIKCDDHTIECYPTHRFYVPGKGWAAPRKLKGTNTHQLEIGDKLFTHMNGSMIISSIKTLWLTQPTTVFTLSIPDAHTFFAGTVLVHNSGLQLFVKFLAGKLLTLDCNSSDTIEDIKTRVHESENIPTVQIRLLFAGKELVDEKTLADYNIQKESTLHCVLREGTQTYPIRIYQGKDSLLLPECHENQKISFIKHKITKEWKVEREKQLLFHGGQELDDDERTLGSYLIGHDDVILSIPYSQGGNILKFMRCIDKKQVALAELKQALQFVKDQTLLEKAIEFGTQYIKKQKTEKKIPKGCLPVGALSVFLWTTNLLTKSINEALSTNNILACKTYLSSLIWGLRDLPYYSGKCYLGVKDFQDLTNYQKGQDICWKNPCGLSKSLKVAEKASNAKGVVFEIEMMAARNVSGLTMTPGEGVMSLPFSCFKVLDILQKENQPTHITLQEICVPRATRTVFWVDDNPKNNFAYMRSLERQDISVLPCPSTKRALEFLESYRWLFFLKWYTFSFNFRYGTCRRHANQLLCWY